MCMHVLYSYVRMYTYMCVCMQPCMHAQIASCMCKSIHVYSCVHIMYTHNCSEILMMIIIANMQELRLRVLTDSNTTKNAGIGPLPVFSDGIVLLYIMYSCS